MIADLFMYTGLGLLGLTILTVVYLLLNYRLEIGNVTKFTCPNCGTMQQHGSKGVEEAGGWICAVCGQKNSFENVEEAGK